jgi:hypothetical protein
MTYWDAEFAVIVSPPIVTGDRSGPAVISGKNGSEASGAFGVKGTVLVPATTTSVLPADVRMTTGV